MVFGMLDPALTGDAHPMHDHAAMEMNSGAPMQMDPSSGRMDMGPSNAAPMQQEPNTQGSDAAASQPASDGMTSVSASSPAAAMPMGSSPADMQGQRSHAYAALNGKIHAEGFLRRTGSHKGAAFRVAPFS